MFWSNVRTVFAKEVRDSLRDRRAVISMFVVPTLVMPLLLLTAGAITAKVVKKAQSEASPVTIVGGADSPQVVAELRADPRLRVVEAEGDFRRMIAEKRVRAAVELPAGFEAALAAGTPATVLLHHYEGELKSGFGVGELERFFRELRERTVAQRLAGRGLPADLVKPFAVQRRNAAPPEKVGGNLVGGIVPYLIILLCFTGAMYPAIDLTAGEKERGTMETLLCSPVSRTALVLGKFFTVLAASLATMACMLGSMLASILAGGAYLAGGAGGLAAGGGAAGPAALVLDPLGAVGVFVMVLPVAVLFAAALLAVALFAKSHKEAQSYVSPLIVVVILPAMMGMLPGVELNAKLALVPILNLTLACKEMLSGVWHWPQLALIFVSTAVYAGAALAVAVRLFKRESVLFRG
ncbi:MAG TPA: ABC transporter permease subunit [Opitutaceae bacterium]|nr:ABC transporter permease subunit [Opitutaceae bacterium]